MFTRRVDNTTNEDKTMAVMTVFPLASAVQAGQMPAPKATPQAQPKPVAVAKTTVQPKAEKKPAVNPVANAAVKLELTRAALAASKELIGAQQIHGAPLDVQRKLSKLTEELIQLVKDIQ